MKFTYLTAVLVGAASAAKVATFSTMTTTATTAQHSHTAIASSHIVAAFIYCNDKFPDYNADKFYQMARMMCFVKVAKDLENQFSNGKREEIEETKTTMTTATTRAPRSSDM